MFPFEQHQRIIFSSKKGYIMPTRFQTVKITKENDVRKRIVDTSLRPGMFLQEGEFRRVEDKYLIRPEIKEFVTKFIEDNMEVSYPSKNTTFTLIESIYFDSENLNFFQDHFDKNLNERFKLRIRRYAPNGTWMKGPYLLELKAKIEGVSNKLRFNISDNIFEELKQGRTIGLTGEIFQINPKVTVETLINRINKINKLIEKHKLAPMISIQYHRKAFEKNDFRVTIDSKLKIDYIGKVNAIKANSLKEKDFWCKVEKIKRKYDDNHKILEVKHLGVIPEWIAKFLDHYDVNKTSFSKYCYSIGNLVVQ